MCDRRVKDPGRCINNKTLKFQLRVMDTGVIGSDYDLQRARDRQKDRWTLFSVFYLFPSPFTDFGFLLWLFSFRFLPCFIPVSMSLSFSLFRSCLSESWCAMLQCNVFSLQPCSDSPVPSVTVCWTHTNAVTHTLTHEHYLHKHVSMCNYSR